MFFHNAKDARLFATMETIKTKQKHVVVPCKKYLCPPDIYFGKDFINGFTVVLFKKILFK